MTGLAMEANGRLWLFCPVPQPTDPARLQVVARAQILDDVTLSPASGVSATTRSVFRAQTGPDGFAGLVGRPTVAVPSTELPGLVISFTLAAEGYDDVTLSGALPPQPGLSPPAGVPPCFAPLDLGLQRLIRSPTHIRGRVLRRQGGAFVPVASAEVRMVAATAVPPLAGAIPPPPPLGGLVGTSVSTDADGEYRFAAPLRFAGIRLQVVAPIAGMAIGLEPRLGETTIVQDFRIG